MPIGRVFVPAYLEEMFALAYIAKVNDLRCLLPALGILTFFFGWGCQNQKGLPQEALEPDVSSILERPVRAWHEASRNLTDVEIDGDSLRVSLSHGGGCGEHRFTLVATGPAMKSLPPKFPLTVLHESTGDPCRALISRELAFDLSPFRLSPHGTMVILLDSLTLTYNYD